MMVFHVSVQAVGLIRNHIDKTFELLKTVWQSEIQYMVVLPDWILRTFSLHMSNVLSD